MKRSFYSIALMLLSALGIQAQTKLDLSLNHIVQGQKTEKFTPSLNSTAKSALQIKSVKSQSIVATPLNVCVIAQLKDGCSLPESSLQNLGVTIGFHEGNFAVLTVPTANLAALDSLPEFVSFSENKIKKFNNNQAREAMHVTDAQDETKATEAGLSQTYTGKGVVVGVFDSGIDFNHNNFRNPTTKETRIKKAIVYSGTTATDYTDPSAIDALTTDCTTETHGTHTSSTAAGSYTGSYVNTNGTTTYTGVQGIANESDLVLAGTPLLYDSNMMDALSKMDAMATSLNEPLVVNLSLGANGGFLDGKETLCKFYDTFTGNGDKPGRIICVSAGNEGGDKISIKGSLNSENNYTLSTFIPTVTNNSINYYQPIIGVYGKDATPFTVQLDFYDSNYEYKGSLTSDDLKSGGYLSYNTYSAHDGRFAAELYFSGYFNMEDNYPYCAVTVTSESKDCQFYLFSSNGDLTDNGQEGFTAGNADLSINVLACTNSVLSVGAWTSHNGFKSYDGSNGYSYQGQNSIGDIASFSSYTTGDDNGIQRPDFSAPGVSIVSGYNSYDTNVWNNGTYQDLQVCGKATEEYLSGHTSIIGAMCGTSMACPNATGVIALWLQKDPSLTVNKIRKIIKATADTDDYTSAKAVRFGYGKINALAGLQGITDDPIIYKKAYDLDGDGKLSISDVTKLLNYLLGK